MAYQHGVYVSEVETSLQTAPAVDASLPFVVGASPKGFEPRVISSWREFVQHSGVTPGTDDVPGEDGWFSHSLVSFAYFWFRIAGRSEAIFCGIESAGLTNGESDLTANDILDKIELLDTIYERTRREPSICVVPYFGSNAVIQNAVAAKMAKYGGRFSGVALCDIPCTNHVLSGDTLTCVNDPANVAAAKVTVSPHLVACWPYVGVGDLRFDLSTALAAGMNRVDGENAGLPFVSPSNKNGYATGIYTCTPVAERTLEGCTFGDPTPDAGGNNAWPVLHAGVNIPFDMSNAYSSPENLGSGFTAVEIDGVQCLALDEPPQADPCSVVVELGTGSFAEESPLFLDRDSTNTLIDGNGVVSMLNTVDGWVFWGNNTTAFPGSGDVKDYLIAIRRMFSYVANTFQVFASRRIDNPLNRRQIEGVVNSFNQILASLQGFGALNAASIELDDERNTTAQLLAGVVYFRIRVAPPPPMKEIHGVLEYDVTGFEASLA